MSDNPKKLSLLKIEEAMGRLFAWGLYLHPGMKKGKVADIAEKNESRVVIAKKPFLKKKALPKKLLLNFVE